MKRREQAAGLIAALKKLYPDAVCALHDEGDPFRLLVMARLSAQCTDARVNLVSRALFEAFPDAEAMGNAPLETLEKLIRSCGLYHTKARDLIAMSKRLTEDFGGQVPSDMEALLSLPGVGRKIANLIRGDVFGLPAVVTDTHCIRICGRLGFYPETLKDPRKIEKILCDVLPPDEQSDFCHRIVIFGREICSARAPACQNCPLSEFCHRAAVERKKKVPGCSDSADM